MSGRLMAPMIPLVTDWCWPISPIAPSEFPAAKQSLANCPGVPAYRGLYRNPLGGAPRLAAL